MSTINGQVCVVDGVAVDKVFSNGKQVYGINYFLYSDNYLIGAGKQQNIIGDISGDNLKKLRGKQVTISVDVDYTNARHEVGQPCRVGIEFRVTYESGSKQYLGVWKPTTAGESFSGQISQTMMFNDEPIISTSTQIWAYAQDAFDSLSMGRPKLETGSLATPWSPAPEDVLEDYIAAPKNLTATVIDVNTEKLDWE